MQMNEPGRRIQMSLELSICAMNTFMLLGLYVANANYSTFGFAKTGFGVMAEGGFAAGLVAVLILLIGRSFQSFFTRWMLLILVTLWNQVCVLLFLISLIPFHLN
jgi:hypothetical protein